MRAGQFVTACAAAIVAGCGGSRLPATPSVPQVLTTEHFVFEYGERDGSTIEATAQALEREHARVTTDLGVQTMPRVRITFHGDHTALANAVRPLVGEIPAWATGLVTGVDRIHMLSPTAALSGGFEGMVVRLVHEFAHCVSLGLNPAFGNRPRWLWEAVAIYEAGQRVDPRSLPYMVRGEPPAFAVLDTFDNTLVYDVGFTIAEFVVAEWGLPSLRALVLSHGDTVATLNVTLPEFESRWFAFVRARYGL